MKRYYVNDEAQTNGDHEVHTKTCSKLPSKRTDLGEFEKCQDAVKAAKKHYEQVNGCAFCSKECHTQ